jgi:hypothetical protein
MAADYISNALLQNVLGPIVLVPIVFVQIASPTDGVVAVGQLFQRICNLLNLTDVVVGSG